MRKSWKKMEFTIGMHLRIRRNVELKRPMTRLNVWKKMGSGQT